MQSDKVLSYGRTKRPHLVRCEPQPSAYGFWASIPHLTQDMLKQDESSVLPASETLSLGFGEVCVCLPVSV